MTLVNLPASTARSTVLCKTNACLEPFSFSVNVLRVYIVFQTEILKVRVVT